MQRVFGLGRLRKKLSLFLKDQHLDKTDRRLLKGFYVNNKWELEPSESEDEKNHTKSNIHTAKRLARALGAGTLHKRQITPVENDGT